MNLKLITFSVFLGLGAATVLYANPEGADIQSGDVSIQTPDLGKMVINQSTDKAIINWKEFNIEDGEQVQYIVPNAGSATLNRVTGNDPSHIFGQLSSNGVLYLINTNGIVFGANSRVNAVALIASTQNISNTDFVNNRNHFASDPTRFKDANINMEGIIQVSNALDVGGKIILNAGTGNVQVGGSLLANGATAGGAVNITGENIHLNSTAIIEANATAQGHGGQIYMMSHHHTKAAGTLSAKGAGAQGVGGTIETSSQQFLDFADLNVDTSGAAGTGTWLLDPEDITLTAADITIIEKSLANNNVNIETNNTLGGNGDITLAGNISWSTGNTLTLSAYRNIDFGTATITMNGAGHLVLDTDNTGTGVGAVLFASPTSKQIIMATGAATDIFYDPTPASGGFSGSQKSVVGADYYANNASGGTLNSYMLVNSATALQSLDGSAYLAGKYGLNVDIDLSGRNFSPIGNLSGSISNNPDFFTGYFNGNNHTISNLTINDTGLGQSNNGYLYSGLFAYLSHAEISNLSLTNVGMTLSNTSNPNGGALAGKADYSTIDNLTVTTSTDPSLAFIVTGGGELGGVLGYGWRSNMSHINTTITITGNGVGLGGIAGEFDGGTVAGVYYGTLSYATTNAQITGDSYIGGMAGAAVYSSFLNTSSSGVFSTQNSSIAVLGGIIGSGQWNGLTIQNSYSDATLTSNGIGGGVEVGGIAGFLSGTTGDTMTLNDNVFNGVITYSSTFTTGEIFGESTIFGTLNITNSFWNSGKSGPGIANGTASTGTGTIIISGGGAVSPSNFTNESSFPGLNFTSTWSMGSTGPSVNDVGALPVASSIALAPAFKGIETPSNNPAVTAQDLASQITFSPSFVGPMLADNTDFGNNNCVRMSENQNHLEIARRACH